MCGYEPNIVPAASSVVPHPAALFAVDLCFALSLSGEMFCYKHLHRPLLHPVNCLPWHDSVSGVRRGNADGERVPLARNLCTPLRHPVWARPVLCHAARRVC